MIIPFWVILYFKPYYQVLSLGSESPPFSYQQLYWNHQSSSNSYFKGSGFSLGNPYSFISNLKNFNLIIQGIILEKECSVAFFLVLIGQSCIFVKGICWWSQFVLIHF